MAQAATVLEMSDGTSEQVAFFDDVFGVTHLPAGEPRGAIVVCSPIFSEFLKNNRREVLLGRTLAERGWAVQRFHYRGTGNSMGRADELTLDTMAQDAATAARRLTELTGIRTPAVLGTLLATFPAIAVAQPDTRIALWEPVIDGRRYFGDLLKTLVIMGMSHGVERSTEDLEDELDATGRLDIAGFSVPRSLRDSARGRTLSMPPGGGDVLLVQLGRKAEVGRSTTRLAQQFEEAGRKVTVEPIPAREAWWFHKDVDQLKPDQDAMLDEAMIAATLRWLTREVPG